MTKQEFVDRVASKTGGSRKDAAEAVDAVLDSIKEMLTGWRDQLHRVREVLDPAPEGAPGRQPAQPDARR